MHFPASLAEAECARQRLARRRKKNRDQADGIAFAPSEKLVPALWDSLPFVPTRAQRRVVAEIVAQMQRPQVMNRLVQGDVGSGKTLVGLCTMLTAVENGYQAAMMAPTEILAEQHRFGVVQRGALYKKGAKPDLLVMTATPIPRTLALTLYGELDVSVIDELPPGRKPIRTALRGEDRRAAIFEFAGDQVSQGRQV